MDVWNNYESRSTVRGLTNRDAVLRRETSSLLRKLPNSLSYHTVDVFDINNGFTPLCEASKPRSFSQDFAIINSDNLNEKTIISLPGEDIEHGSLISWMDNHWLVTERDANSEVYTKAKMIQCNYQLRWVEEYGHIYEQWCIIEDGTKYLTGEFEDRNFVTTRGDSRISLTLARNEHTKLFTRSNRFLIDDPESPIKLAYALTKPLKFGLSYNNQGVYRFVLQEVNSTGDDNIEMGIADYYKYYPKVATEISLNKGERYDDKGRRVFI